MERPKFIGTRQDVVDAICVLAKKKEQIPDPLERAGIEKLQRRMFESVFKKSGNIFKQR